jgi:hypothetical protein
MAVSPNHVPSIPDCSIEGIQPTVKQIEPYEKGNDKWGKPKQCCICDKIATKTATYSIQGAQVVERYCDSCVEKQFSRIDK